MRKRSMTAAAAAVCVFLGCALTGTGPAAQEEAPSYRPDEVTPVLARVLTTPRTAALSDGTFHVNYELVLINAVSSDFTIDSIEVIDPLERGAMVRSLSAEEVARNIRIPGSTKPSAVLAPSQAGYVRIDLIFPSGDEVPRAIEHIITATTDKPGPLIPRRVAETVARTDVITGQPVVIASPVRGSRWLMAGIGGNGPHRTTIMPIGGWWTAPERWAVDLLRLDDQGRPWTGSIADNGNYPQFGAEVVAVSDGVIERVRDGMPDIPAGEMPKEMTLGDAAGNYVFQDIGNGYRALYAHLKEGSVMVKEGQKVRKDQVLGLLGNSGNTDAPHLHFQVVDGPQPFASDGVPYVIDSFTVTGQVASLEEVEGDFKSGKPVKIETGRSAGTYTGLMPADGSLVDF